ncbi:MAG TPA: 2-oxo-4-hydroxy-4-carboxy-5-ureidoimidazoline decarboxylase [Segeticoccus sp.]|uniref:2-oxo-4-hydroxy-4-carboxy-5-ureidoimidazoline decarboxylase n=1 Tax=Segeticoccus sp. TaxID=2706531 RepID=UPI002D7FFF11|nr:2-oxo-4-hydroxy-4-carboxy-5-ureidoimidazoline decarboxylase [Segeticoccus sp.]HET8601145.1 2-oxo-4-hydroxy-4-carboxy-5-ureidoimidazoline decarboxylase [Segeticoccus sp.]
MGPLDRLNADPAAQVLPTLLACCDVPAWADAVLAGRPYASAQELYAVADAAARDFSPAEVDRALAAHPRIGQRVRGNGTGAGWSRQEQSGVATDSATQQALQDGNRAYENRFGRVFLICATGLSSEEILSSLRERLEHDEQTEAAVVAEELRKIALLRLSKAVDET